MTLPTRAAGRPAVGVLLATLLAILLATPLLPGADAAPGSPAGERGHARPVVTAVAGVPAALAPRASFAARVEVRNRGAARTRRTTLTLRLSTDRRAGQGDPVVGTARVDPLRAGRGTRVRVRSAVPARTSPGRYHLLACAAGRCTAASGTLRVTGDPRPPAPGGAALRGTLTGDLHLVDAGAHDEGPHRDRWAHDAHVSVQMAVSGPDTVSARFASTGSQYRLAGSRTQEGPAGPCLRVVEETRAGEGRLAWDGDPYRDDIDADFARTDMSALSLRIELGYQRTVDETWTGEDETCTVDTTETRPALDVEELQLTQVGRTATAVTYAVTAVRGPQGTTSDWDRVDGTLVLALS